MGCPYRLSKVLKVHLCSTVSEEGNCARTVILYDLTETLADLAVRLIPADVAKHGFASFTRTYLWRLETVLSLPEADTSDASGAQFATAERMPRYRADVEWLALVTDLYIDPALPEAHTTDRPDGTHCGWREVAGVIDVGGVGCLGWFAIKQDACSNACCPNEAVAKKVTPGRIIGTHVAPIGKNSQEAYIRSH